MVYTVVYSNILHFLDLYSYIYTYLFHIIYRTYSEELYFIFPNIFFLYITPKIPPNPKTTQNSRYRHPINKKEIVPLAERARNTTEK